MSPDFIVDDRSHLDSIENRQVNNDAVNNRQVNNDFSQVEDKKSLGGISRKDA